MRCAIYTRKSTEEGLDQAYNSLHAQRDACEAYIRSQAHEGWKLVKAAYDDGGFSGGSMDRPALKRLLADVAAGRVQTIVVYKIDRLTRSLADFARIVETLDGQGASFVSVTQQFNTTTSMGRLTLNVLLSFAQFEREVAGERIRDKIAASKARGLWMGGTVPIGYDVNDRSLVINEAEASTVQEIFQGYLRLGSVEALQKDLKQRGIVSKRWTSSSGRTRGGCNFSRGALHCLLRNPVYIGQVRHKDRVHPGQQVPIVDQALWQAVQDRLAEHLKRHARTNEASGRPLQGRLFDAKGNVMSPSWTTKPNGKRYSYYISQAVLQGRREKAGLVTRVSADVIDRLVGQAIFQGSAFEAASLRARVARVTLHDDRVEIVRNGANATAGEGEPIVVPVCFIRHARAKVLDDGQPLAAPAVVKALGRAHKWRSWLERGEVNSWETIAVRAGVSPVYVRQLLPLAFLAPDLTRRLLDGRWRPRGGLRALLRKTIPLHWERQRAEL
ncbi:MAG: recombinase family protein [Proteobacteria bacterium]|nr:recombinase family protein [Pseudomonadota bacterium]